MKIKVWLKLLVMLITVSCGLFSFSWAAIDTYPFESEDQRERFKVLTDELRCPKCQNQNIADSNAPIAKDFREEIYQQLLAGQSNKAIVDFMVARYGEFVLYRPTFSRKTWLLWLGPFVLLILGGGIFYHLTHKKQLSDDSVSASNKLTEDEQRQIEAIIHQHEEPKS